MQIARDARSRLRFVAGFACVSLFLPAAVALGQTPSCLNRVLPALESSCRELDCLWLVTEKFDLPIGIEFPAGARRWPAPPEARSPFSMPATTVRTLFDDFVRAFPNYEWREIDGFVVVRPVAAWRDEGNPLNRTLPGFELTSVTGFEAVEYLARSIDAAGRNAPTSDPIVEDRTSARRPTTAGTSGFRIANPFRFSVRFPGGSALDAIILITRASGGTAWSLSYRPTTHTSTLNGKVRTWQTLHPSLYLYHRPRG